MPGVASYVWGGPQTFLFTATSPEARVKLQQLVERKLDGAWGARWSGECSGPGCKPGPVPPTGEV